MHVCVWEGLVLSHSSVTPRAQLTASATHLSLPPPVVLLVLPAVLVLVFLSTLLPSRLLL